MERLREPLQGVRNIVRFNWHHYAVAGAATGVFVALGLSSVAITVVVLTMISLTVSLYVYDLSGFYTLDWLDQLVPAQRGLTANIHAGFDETSALFREKYPNADLRVFDFYDPSKHTEVSIRRARKAFPAPPGTEQVRTSKLPLLSGSTQTIYIIFAAHEIRSEEERVQFFREISRALTDDGKVIVTEHLRNAKNFLAYNVGFFHFLPRSAWTRTFAAAGLQISVENKYTPFVTTFLLQKRGAAS